MKIKLILSTLLVVFSLNSMERPERRGGRPHTDVRKIAILSWGSLIQDPRNLKIEGAFEKSSLKLPIELFRVSGKGTDNQRLTRIIDKEAGVPISIWHAPSSYTYLPDARENLKEREGTTRPNIFYMKTMLPGRTPDDNEVGLIDRQSRPLVDSQGRRWYIMLEGIKQMKAADIIAIADWASTKGYDAVIWTGLGRTAGYENEGDLRDLLRNNRMTRHNTIRYINSIYGEVEISPFQSRLELTPFEKYVLNTYTRRNQ